MMAVFDADTHNEVDVADVIDALKRFRRGKCLNGLSVREMIEQGREQPSVKQGTELR